MNNLCINECLTLFLPIYWSIIKIIIENKESAAAEAAAAETEDQQANSLKCEE